MSDYGTVVLQSFPTCPECGAPWPSDNMHIHGGHCPGRPAGCTCRHDIQYHRERLGCWTRRDGVCPCPYNRRPTDYSKEVRS